MSETVQRVVDLIHAAFRDVRRDDGVSLHEANVIDDYGSPQERAKARAKDQETRWEDVPGEDIERHQILPFLDTKGFRYYLAAYMVWALRHCRSSASASIDATIYNLDLSPSEKLKTWQLERFSIFDSPQNQAIAEFLLYMAHHADGHVDDRVAREALSKHWNQFL